MPVKRRTPKRRSDPVAAAAAWSMAFDTGHDFLGELTDYGFPAGPAGDGPIREAMEEAWQQFGAIYLERFHDPASRPPYALEAFEAPPPCR